MSFEEPPPLPGFITDLLPFERRVFVDAARGDRVHFIDHGSHTGQPVFLQHGNPMWSFLWRKIIERLDADRFRCIAPDLLGLGWSTRLPRVNDHTLDRHLGALGALFDGLGLQRVILVGQDWGGPLVAGLGATFPERIAGLVLANTSVFAPRRPRGTPLHRFARIPVLSALAFRSTSLPYRFLRLLQGDRASIRGDVARAYRWPLRRMRDRVAPLGLLRMVPSHPDHPSLPGLRRGDAWARAFAGPMALVWGMRDPLLGARICRRHQEAFPHAPLTETEAGHFLQEEVPDALAEAIRDVADRA